MGILDRYIARAVLGGSLAVLLIIVSMELIFAFVDESADVDDQYTAFNALLYVVLGAPQRAYEAFPIATLIGSLMTLGGMAARHELVVMRAAGVSMLGIARPVMLAGLLLAAVAAAIGEFIAPPAERAALDVEAQARGGEVSMLSRAGFWVRDGRRFIRVGSATTAEHLRDLRIHVFTEDRRLEAVITAEQANYRGGGWRLEGVERTAITPDGVSVEQRAEASLEGGLRPEVLDVVVVDPETLSLQALHTYIGYLDDNELESERYRLAFWLKVATPIATMAMLLLTLPLAFGALRSAGAGQRIFIGVMIGIAFHLANRLLGHIGLVYGIPAAVSALLPAALCLIAALVLLRRIR